MQRYRTKPVKTEYVDAILDKPNNVAIVQPCTATGKPEGHPKSMPLKDFEATYDPLVRTPRVKQTVSA
jgi:hypothetical protein